MNKIGILNCSHIVNFGSVLQSYAVEEMVHRLSGYDVESIRYSQKKDLLYLKNYIHLLTEKDILKFKFKGLKRKVLLRTFYRGLYKKCKVREEYFRIFVKNNFKLSKVYNGYDELIEGARDYRGFILGSDQVWHPINYGSHYYTMEWIPENIPKITYAASFGVSSLPDYQKEGTKKFLNRINFISVREKMGQNIINELCQKEVDIVADPTLLLETSEWLKLCKDICEEDYIFCYFLGDNIYARKYAKKLSETTGLKIICVPFMDEINKIDMSFGDIQLFDIGPSEFLSYINKARYVVTDSFHGTIFSIIFQKKFVVFNRFSSNKGGSTNSRIDTLLEQVGLENRRGFDEKFDIDKNIDYDNVINKVEYLRKESKKYLVDSLVKLDIMNK